jgi:regulator of ribonuclease activity A
MNQMVDPVKTTDLYDQYEEKLLVADPVFRHFGGHISFHGAIATVQCFEDNSLVKEQLSRPGNGQVLVVDGGGSLRCALMGDLIAQLAIDNNWAGVVINACVRDAEDLAKMPLGVCALAAIPRKSKKEGKGLVGVPVHFAGINFLPGDQLYADLDGILILPQGTGQ